MTKMIKMSLVAAVAVAGFTTTASAQTAENAIKNVSVKGYFQYRWNKDMEAKKSFVNDRNKFRLQATAKANDTVSFTARATDNTGTLDIDRKYLTASLGKATVIAGNFSDLSPFSDGTGINGEAVLFSAAKGLTLGAAYYHMDQGANLASDAKDIAAVTALGNAGSVNYALWYVSHKDTNNYIYASANAKIASANVELAYSSKKPETGDTQTQLRLIASTKIDTISLTAGAIMAGKDGADVNLNYKANGTGDGSDTKADFGSAQIATSTASDATGLYLNVGAKVSPAVGVSAEYYTIDGGKDLSVKASYALAKNTATYIRYSVGNDTDTAGAADFKKLRVEMKYSF